MFNYTEITPVSTHDPFVHFKRSVVLVIDIDAQALETVDFFKRIIHYFPINTIKFLNYVTPVFVRIFRPNL